MKKILGLDLGTTSIGWALVNEAENSKEKSSIIKTGVRLVPLDNFTNSEGKDIKMKISDAFASGVGVSTRAARRSAKSARVNGERFKMRRDSIIRILTENHWIDSETALCEDGKNTTQERKVVIQGLKDYIVAEKDGTLLICRLDEEQRTKQFSAE